MPKILVVEDSKEVLSNISMLLKMNGYEVLEAVNGQHGIETAKKQLPDLIISDVMMPVSDGMQLLQEVRKEPDLVTTPFIFLTAKVDRKDVRTGMNTGADDYVTKPFKSKELIDAIESQLKKKLAKEKKFQEIYKSISAYIPHELRTPLVAIYGYTNFLLDDFDTLEKDEAIDMLKNIKAASTRLHKTIEKFIRFNDIELFVANKRDYLQQMDEIVDFPESTVSFGAVKISEEYERPNDLIISIENVPLKIYSEHLVIIAEELIDNAFKFSGTGSNVIVNGFIDGSSYVFEVKDFGCGMTKEELNNIAPFIQASRQKYEQSGNGLGLSTVKLLADLYSLKFEIDSEKDSHTSVRIRFNVVTN